MRDDEAGQAAGQGEGACFAQKLTDQVPPARADRKPDRDFAGARGAPGQKQVGDIRARDQQNEARDAEQQHQRFFRLAGDGALPSRTVFQKDRFRSEPRHRLLAHVLLQGRLHVIENGTISRVERRVRLLRKTPGFSRAKR